MESILLNRKDVCAVLKISLPTLHRLVKRNELKPIYLGSLPRFRRSEVERFIDGLSSKDGDTVKSSGK